MPKPTDYNKHVKILKNIVNDNFIDEIYVF